MESNLLEERIMCKTICSLLAVGGMMMILSMPLAAQEPVTVEAAGLKVILPDTWIFKTDIDHGDYWEPTTDVFGDGTLAVCAGVPGEDPSGMALPGTMNAKVAFISPDGTVREYWGFYDDAGNPYIDNFNTKRQTGNPPRIACDRRPGGVRYIVGQEATPWEFTEFTPDRWTSPFLYDERVSAVQLFEKTAAGPKPIIDVIEPLYYGTEGAQGGGHMRFGGDLVFLSNGNFVVVPEDRTGNTVGGNAAVAAIYNGETGERITPAFVGTGSGRNREIWSNVVAFKGGFMIRASGELTTFDNSGNVLLSLLQTDLSSVTDVGRADDTRIAGNINHEFIYLAGENADTEIIVTKINAVTGELVKEVVVTEEYFFDFMDANGQLPFSRENSATDENGNVIITWDATLYGSNPDALARIFNSDLEPLTPTFYVFNNHNSGAEGDKGIYLHEGDVAMDGNRIVISFNGTFLDPATGNPTPKEHTLVTVIENPTKPMAVRDWELQ